METQLSLQAFWDAVEQRLAACSAEELRAIVRALAQATPPMEQQAFLDIVQLPVATTAVAQQASAPEGLLADITALVDALRTAMAAAHSWDEYDEEDSLAPYEAFVEPLTALFDRAAAVFDSSDATLVRAAYRNLFEALYLEDDYGRGVRAEHLHGVDIGAASARYLRAVYDSETPAHRSAVLYTAMLQVRSWLDGPRPMLHDVMRSSLSSLPDEKQFCRDWIAFLHTQSGSDADAWLREAVRLAQGTPGLAALARAEGVRHPRAYLDWCTALEAEGQHHAVLIAAQEALLSLPAQLPLRAAVADCLCTAAARLHDTATLQSGRWEAFMARPVLARLLDVWEAIPTGTARMKRMHQAAHHVQSVLSHPPSQAMHVWEDALESPVWPDKAVLAHAYLLAGDWDTAYRLAVPEQVLGWSSSHNPQGLVVSCFLIHTCGALPGNLPPNLTQLWHWELQNSTGFVWHNEDAGEASLVTRLQCAYTEHLPEVSWPSDRQTELLAWCLDVAQRRVDAIVSNQHSGSYDKAALLLAACAELLRCRDKAQEATTLLDHARQQFSRHRAFQVELQAAVRRMGA